MHASGWQFMAEIWWKKVKDKQLARGEIEYMYGAMFYAAEVGQTINSPNNL